MRAIATDVCPDCGRPITPLPSGWWTHDGMPNGCWRLSMDGPSELKFPATYELDPETGESLGFVHPYCSTECQSADIENVPAPRSVEPDGGDEVGDELTTCCGCGTVLSRGGGDCEGEE